MWDEALLFLVPFWCQIFDAFIVLRWATVARIGLLLHSCNRGPVLKISQKTEIRINLFNEELSLFVYIADHSWSVGSKKKTYNRIGGLKREEYTFNPSFFWKRVGGGGDESHSWLLWVTRDHCAWFKNIIKLIKKNATHIKIVFM